MLHFIVNVIYAVRTLVVREENMLLELQVKNLALIEQAQVEFGEGLNILTGETDRKSVV